MVGDFAEPPVIERVKPKWYRRRLFRFFIVPVASLLVVFLIRYYAGKAEARQRLDALLAAIRERGEPVLYADLEPEPLAPEEDGTAPLTRAIELYDNLEVQSSFESVLETTFNKLNIARDETDGLIPHFFRDAGAANQLDALRQRMGQNTEILELIHEVGQRGRVQLPHDYTPELPARYEPPASMRVRELAYLLAADTALSVRAEDAARAAERIGDMLRLSHALRGEPRMLTQLIRVVVAELALDALSHGMSAVDFDQPSRLMLDSTLAEIEGSYLLRETIIAERTALLAGMRDAADGKTVVPGLLDDHSYFRFYYENFEAVQLEDQATLIEYMNHLAESIDATGPGSEQALNDAFDAIVDDEPSRHILTSTLTPAFRTVRPAVVGLRQRLRNARLALRGDQFYRRTGEFPATPDQIANEFPATPLPEIPPGLFSSQVTVFRIVDSSFLIYDVGEDQQDGQLNPPYDEHELQSLMKLRYETAR